MKILLIIGGLIVLAAAGLAVFIQLSKPRAADYRDRTAPRLAEKDGVTVLKVPFHGDPDTVITRAYKDLFKAYYKCKGVSKGPSQPPTLARYEGFDELVLKTDEKDMKSFPWTGFAAIPVPAGTALPEGAPETVSLEALDYGRVAEAVHFGPYETEHDTIRALHEFIDREGYRISGLHEEEYILGPGTPLSRPDEYITVIRYQVEKKES